MRGIGIIGCGVMGRIHGECFKLMGTARVVATFDTDTESSEALARTHAARSCASLDELLSLEEVEAVYVCTRHDSHHGIVVKAANVGKPVFCEKPLALSLKESVAIADTVRQSRIRFMTGLNFRWSPAIRRVRAMVQAGEVRPLCVSAVFSAPHYLEGWQGLPSQGGGIILSLGIHAFDLIPYLLGNEVDSVSCGAARLRLSEPYLEDSAHVRLRLANGTYASVVLHDYSPDTYCFSPELRLVQISLYGDLCAVHVGLDRVEVFNVRQRQVAAESGYPCIEQNDLLWSRGYVQENEHFISSISGNRDPEVGVDCGVRAAAVAEAARRSASEKREVAVREVFD
jgi:myo-inositol 2-dehydrogenase/D-chiro-inositol 1-dehydrogenase